MERKDYFYKRWQQINVNDNNQVGEKADIIREFINQILAARGAKILDAESCSDLTTRETDKYAGLADSLSQYAYGGSQLWKCSLNISKACELDCVKRYKKFQEAVQQSVLPQGKENELIQISPETRVPRSTTSLSVKNQLFSQPGFNVTENFLDINQQGKKSNTSTGSGNFITNESSGFPALKKPEPVLKRSRDMSGDEESENNTGVTSMFTTARQQLAIDNQKKYGRNHGGQGSLSSAYGINKKSLGTRRGINSKFVPPVMNREDNDDGGILVKKAGPNKALQIGENEEEIDERLKHIDPKMVELIMSEIMYQGHPLTWEDIAGLEFAKKTIQEIVVWPMLRPDIFTGLRGPPKGLLLFGPPGTGKTLIGKCIASQSKSTFFSISASSLTSKWVGEGEKMVRALFAVACVHQPAVVFIDEIDSLLSQRSDSEHESSRRIKTEFLVQLDGASTGETDRILVIGATNRPQEIDEAARRRFVKRLYIPLPEGEARQQIIKNLLSQQRHYLEEAEISSIIEKSLGYSGADMANLCREAALGPIRSIPLSDIQNIAADQVRPILYGDFEDAFKQVRASVSQKDLDLYIEWNKQYGSWGI